MEQRRLDLVDALFGIEIELRRLGLWEVLPPPQAALASQSPFCVDTLSFSQWLQWVCLPRFKALIEVDDELPTASAILAMAEWVYADRLAEMRALLGYLQRLDALLAGG